MERAVSAFHLMDLRGLLRSNPVSAPDNGRLHNLAKFLAQGQGGHHVGEVRNQPYTTTTMKNKIALLAGLAVAAFSNPAFADITIRITGSTAMRSQVDAVLTTTLGYSRDAFIGASGSGSSRQIYSIGTTPSKTTIKTSWSGSVAGVQAIAQNLTNLTFLPDSASGGSLASNAATETGAADIAFSDCWQQATIFNSPVLADTIVGVVQFRWVTNEGSPITNITPQQVRVLYESGKLPLSFFTGNPANASTFVYAMGRDPDSGTRVTAFAETGLGTNPTVLQYKATVDSGAMTEIFPYPATTKFGVSLGIGNDGESSGGTLATYIGATSASTAVRTATGVTAGEVAATQIYTIGYLGTSDATTAVTNGGQIIGYNGVNPSTAGTALADAIKGGSYHFWSYLHCMHGGLTGDKLTFYNTISNTLKTTASGGIALSDMLVERLSDGGNIVKK